MPQTAETRAGTSHDRTHDDDGQSQSLLRALVTGLGAAVGVGDRDDTGGSLRTVAVAFLANLVVALAKYAGFFITRSSAMLAESLHSTATTVNQLLLLKGHVSAQRPETPQHPFGYGHVRYFWAFVVAVVMFGLGSVLSIGRGVMQLIGGGEELRLWWVPVAALTVGLVMDGSSFVVALREANAARGEHSLREHLTRSRNPEVTMVFLEDFAAIIGLAFAYTGIALTVITGNSAYDAIASILIGVLLGAVAGFLAREMRSLIVGESALPEEARIIEERLRGHASVEDLIYFRSLYLGPDDLLIEAKVEFDGGLRVRDVVAAVDEIEASIREALPHARLISIEPDSMDAARTEAPDYDRPNAGPQQS